MPICTATLALGSVSGSLLFSSTDITSSNLHSSSVSSLLSPISNFSKHSQRYCCSSRRTPWVCSANKVTGNTEINGEASPVLQDSSVTPTEAIRQARVSFVSFVFGFSHQKFDAIVVWYKTFFFGIGGESVLVARIKKHKKRNVSLLVKKVFCILVLGSLSELILSFCKELEVS